MEPSRMNVDTFNYLLFGLMIVNAAWVAWYGHYGQAWYWVSAASITASVAWGMK